MPVVRIPTVLRKHTDGEAKLEASGSTVREAFKDLVGRYPDLEEQLFDGEDVRGFINVYVEDEDIRYIDGLDSTVEDDDEISIMPAVAGGAEPEAIATGPATMTAGQPQASTHGAAHPAGGAD